jgi:hypothetical protein
MSALMTASPLAHQVLDLAGAVVAQLPDNPNPQAPPGAEKVTMILGYVKWGAGAAIVAGFFAGLILFAGGRIADHHRFGRMGTITMFASVGSAFLYAIGYSMLSTFAGG